MTGHTYPSGHTVTYAYDQSGRLASFTGTVGDGTSRSYASGITYNAESQVEQEQFGTQVPLYHKRRYTVRGHLGQVRLGTTAGDDGWNRGALIFHYGSAWATSGPETNGNLLRADVYIPTDDQISSHTAYSSYYEYDALNRLTSVREAANGGGVGWQQSYTYDRWGNRTINAAGTSGSGISTRGFGVDAATNRLAVPSGAAGTIGYDAAGNLITDTYTGAGAGTRRYDAEGRLTEAQAADGVSTFTYDGTGRRVKRSTGGGAVEVWQVYGMDGEVVAEYAASASPSAPTTEYGYRGGELLITATAEGDVRWIVADQLGTARMVVDKTGSLAGVSRHDYLPFGEELFAGVGGRTTGQGYSGNDNVRQKFTGYERDTETGLDFAQSRYYANTHGRFTSPDEAFADQEEGDPQSWNLYSYVRNNPLRFNDPSGLARYNKNGEWVGDYDDEYDRDLGARWTGNNWDFGGDKSPIQVMGQLSVWQRVADAFSSLDGRMGMTGDIGRDVWTVAQQFGAGDPTLYLGGGGKAVGNILRSGIGFTSGTAKVALTVDRLQHSSRHLIQAGILPSWSKATGQQFTRLASRILENPVKTFDHTLGGTAVRGFSGQANGRDVVIFVFKEGPHQGKVATAVVPTAQQAANWGLK